MAVSPLICRFIRSWCRTGHPLRVALSHTATEAQGTTDPPYREPDESCPVTFQSSWSHQDLSGRLGGGGQMATMCP